MTPSKSLRHFANDESGVLLAETLILLPLLIWAFLALVVYWDVFRTINSTQKAAYAISDVISRQAELTPGFVSGMQSVMDFLMEGSFDARLRITGIQYNGTDDKYVKLFSESPGGTMPGLTLSQITAMKDHIPLMAHKDSLIIVETEVDYVPGFNIGLNNVVTGLSDQTIGQFIVTRPRIYRRVCMTTPVCPADM